MVQLMMGSRAATGTLLLLGLLLGIGLSAAPAFAAEGDEEYKEGVKAEARKDYDEALRLYQEALKLDPTSLVFEIAERRSRLQAGTAHVTKGNQFEDQGLLQEALAEFERAANLDPSNTAAHQGITRVQRLIEEQRTPSTASAGPIAAESALGPPQLKPLSQAPINLRMTNQPKVVFQTIGKLAGVNVLFDPDYQPPTKAITVELNNVSLEDALNQSALLTKTFWKPITQNTILVVPDTTVKRREQEEQVIKTFYLSNPITPQELTEAVTAIRSLLETRRIQQINSLNAIIIRDTPDKVAIAEKIIHDLDKAKPEVVVDVAVIEIRRNRSRELGLFPVSSGGPGIQVPVGFNPSRTTGGTTTTTNGVTTTTGGTTTSTGGIGLNRLGKLSTADFSIVLPGASLTALLGDSTTRILQRPQVRASNGQQASLRIGDRVPIATGSFQPGIGGVGVNPLVNTQFQYLDVGVNLDITPTVHANNEITLKVKVEVSQVTSEANIGGIQQPIIGQRIVEHEIRLKEGETNILGGLLQSQTTKSVSGIPGLSQIPLLKYLFSNIRDTISEDEVLIVLTPHIIRVPEILALNRRTLDIGTEGNIRLRHARIAVDDLEEAPAGAAGAGTTNAVRMHFQSAGMVQKVGETFQVPLQIENVRDASSVSFEISFDASLMSLVKISNGDFLGKDSQPVAVVQRPGEQPGRVTATLTRPPATPALSGSGTLALLTFQADAAGKSSLAISSAEIRSTAPAALPVEGTQTTVMIQ